MGHTEPGGFFTGQCGDLQKQWRKRKAMAKKGRVGQERALQQHCIMKRVVSIHFKAANKILQSVLGRD